MKIETTEKYQAWIAQNITETYGCCKEATDAMVLAFPELKQVRGHYLCPLWGQRTHWWLVDEWGSIVDPTADQFPSKGGGLYEPWDESREEPTGICPNCGAYAYGTYCCSERCHEEYAAYCSNP